MEIIWQPSATEDLENARHYIAQVNPTAATRIFDTIRAVVRGLAGSPLSGHPGRAEGTREMVVPHTPYLIVYAVIDDNLVVLAVPHHSQDWPGTF